jgi:phospholipid/cholesterol/gamma-HCH transport system permease protein
LDSPLPVDECSPTSARRAEAGITRDPGATVRCTGAWTLEQAAGLERRLAGLAWPQSPQVVLDLGGVSALDTAGAWLLHRMVARLEGAGRRVQLRGLQPEQEALLETVRATVAARAEAGAAPRQPRLLEALGVRSAGAAHGGVGLLSFVGESARALLGWLLHPRRIRWRTVLHELQLAGWNALPITGLLAFLMGVVIAYQGAQQLRLYGANIFVADLVGLAMVRELAPLLTAIIVAGRSGSAYAAQIGTMKVTEEVDALRTIGLPPLELLVLPKILALLIALPLLTVFADLLGVLGGMAMANVQLAITFGDFLDRLREAVTLSSFFIGIGKAPVFAAVIALIGCYQGLQVTGSADSVGRKTTVAVVQGIFLVIVIDAVFSVIFSMLGI